MKRDLDLIRSILIEIESNKEDKTLNSSDFLYLNNDKNTIDYHLYLLNDAGYIDAIDVTCIGHRYPQYLIKWLTNDGCEYLDTIRDDSVWSKTKDKIYSVGNALTLSTVKSVASNVSLDQLGL